MTVRCDHADDPKCPVRAQQLECEHFLEHKYAEGCFDSSFCVDSNDALVFEEVRCRKTEVAIQEERQRELRMAELVARRKALWKEVDEINREMKELKA